jgi:hypothetical protein
LEGKSTHGFAIFFFALVASKSKVQAERERETLPQSSRLVTTAQYTSLLLLLLLLVVE